MRFGYRDFQARGRNFYLNGKRIYLFGENWPVYSQGGLGKKPAVETREMAKDLQDYKSHGYNILRTAHMPAMPVLYDLADELGIMVYDEWSWSFTSNIQEDEFARRNDKELTEWIYRDYNHPSVVMWSGGNEVTHAVSPAVKRQLDRQVDLIHSLDLSHRPASSFSGAACQLTYGMGKLNTDVLDLHNYIGMGVYPWTVWNSAFDSDYRRLALTYARTEKEFQKPFIIWECVGFTWGWHMNKDFQQNDVKQYAEYVAKEDISNWGEHYGIGLAGSLGLHTALTKSVYVGRGPYGLRILGLIRQNPDVQGFAPWFSEPRLPEATVWNQPVYSGLRNKACLTPRNLFWGRKSSYSLFVVNSTTRLWDRDSAATTYMVNLLNYLIGSGPMYPKALPWVQQSDRAKVSDDAKLTPINLKPYANRDFADRSDQNGPEGWTGQGSQNDMRSIPLGVQMVGKVPFEVIDPAKNHSRAALILRGSHCPTLPAKITGIRIGDTYKRMFFLHGMGWGHEGEAGRYRFHYADGKTSDFVLIVGRHIGDWWDVTDLAEAWTGVTTTNGMGHTIGLYVTAWTNPRPDETIVSMDFLSVGSDQEVNYSSAAACIPFLVAATGEQ